MTGTALDSAAKIAVLNLLAVDGLGAGTVIRLIEHFGSPAAVFAASESQLAQIPRLAGTVAARIRTTRPDGETGRRQYESALQAGMDIRTYWDEDYPVRLRDLETDAPAVLFIRGTLIPDAVRLAVVGTRAATTYGRRATRDLIAGLHGHGVHVVSGLASGIDGAAHEAALEAGLPTEAVFGCGVDVIYPSVNTSLANRILAAGGALVSEYAPGTRPDRHHFPARNRIIAGLARATLVVEAGDKSGALITAMLAVEYNRDVVAVPGAITNPRAAGCHSLIKNGAGLVENSDDLLHALRLHPSASGAVRQTEIVLDESEAGLMRHLDATEAVHIDALSARLSVSVGELLGQLLLLELKGAIKQLPGKYFVRS